ncbi:transient receptor potential cation channel subfamily V member 5, partial [Frankliniella occidentalis]|uniref:Transient receptor potential cation channel subfamily V member 5 n=1 Tax=Frankliniella occidentalis TaxID=133901 RepID=A0A9C6XVL2_FRAOC
MGNAESNVTSGVKNQAGPSVQPLYKLVDVKGGGLLVDMMKRASANKQYAELDHAIKTKVEPFLYNKGQGRLIPVSILVLLRNKDRGRHKMLPPLKNMSDPSEYNINTALAQLDAQGDDGKDPGGYRDVCWDLAERGAVGETILHLCILAASSLHNDLLKRLLRFYPKLVNDIYMNDEYYGEGLLHIAIVNEDPAMVKFLLNAGADVNERCFGNFMSPEDQKASRNDSLDHEWVNVTPLTNYEGYVYWGEYPISFAACLGQEECYRLILARGANPDSQDTNGNTVLHMLVIYKNQQMFDAAYELGSSLAVRNVLNLTPLTLAAKLARRDMFFHILNIEREIYWQIGSVTCAAYPLSQIDTIDIQTGNISKDSALNLVVFGDSNEHLELMEGVLVDLLHAKWNAFVKNRFYRQFFQFVLYFLISLVCFTLRPGPPRSTGLQNSTAGFNGTTESPTGPYTHRRPMGCLPHGRWRRGASFQNTTHS